MSLGPWLLSAGVSMAAWASSQHGGQVPRAFLWPCLRNHLGSLPPYSLDLAIIEVHSGSRRKDIDPAT